MTKVISAYDARTNFGEIISQVYYQNEEIIVTKTGKPMVKIVKADGKKDTMTSFGLEELYGVWAKRKDWKGKKSSAIVREQRGKRLKLVYGKV